MILFDFLPILGGFDLHFVGISRYVSFALSLFTILERLFSLMFVGRHLVVFKLGDQ